ncbi:NUDIX hydrolase [Tessaracoccus sp. OH4464_COT-324]|uniref:NUDIX hydrolase n=1 Tax=Tessaracoccus sp. OH4464_COT-324 TaxID=2491059 RepID=UPI000F6375AD|nr:NUDIX hydrolase [Tessaracoccus sp. OH4464_COT-324]RRD47903.1 NUDIX hydrolase [Tessaracoccus sp. OH4464_COT-324]
MGKEFSVQVTVGSDGTARLSWAQQEVSVDLLAQGISLAADDALVGRKLRRLSVRIPANDVPARRALHQAGFRLEGRLREEISTPVGDHLDLLIYARLASDVVQGAQGFSAVMDSVLPKKRLIAHVLFRDETGRVLLLETSYKDDWELPGGVVEPGESPRIGAAREVHEEIGLLIKLDQPGLIDWMPPSLGWSDAVEFIFDGGVLPSSVVGGLTPGDQEVKALHWVAPAEVAEHVSELSARRISRLLAGDRGYSEAGF